MTYVFYLSLQPAMDRAKMVLRHGEIVYIRAEPHDGKTAPGALDEAEMREDETIMNAHDLDELPLR